MSVDVLINEVGPRDGLQSQGKTLTVGQRAELIGALVDAGISAIEAGSFVSPKAVPQMAGTNELYALLPAAEHVAYSALVPNMRGYDLAVAAGARTVNVVLSATETMNQKNIRMSLEQTTSVCAEIMQRCRQDGINGQAYVAVAFSCPFEGETSQSVVRSLSDRMMEAGAGKVIIADTIGAANPRQVTGLMHDLVGSISAERLSCHFHDTRGMALANVLAALNEGVREFDSSIGGLGGCPFSPGASGNLATEDLALMLESMGMDIGFAAQRLVPVVRTAERLTGITLGGHSFRWLARQVESEEQGGGA
ncbi:hydroxymethylglutaryl-CoA lyase [Pseudomonas abyssi]|uniref:Hydroxymethylglutaryl-CoA lyase n=1 Tax=Pseudomonas abyssi TaxID=170540 RepID=A0A395R0I4_9PSED|nr:hydroxymethylglutaryl-CoA lyase [Halopseudomonas gallaeciensis]RGP53645.1 hydroxymethylglutaryl-CoA lyase [Halopseudomonas gallaeciensis]